MLSIANEVDPLIFRCICLVCDTNMYFSNSYNILVFSLFTSSKGLKLLDLFSLAYISKPNVFLQFVTYVR